MRLRFLGAPHVSKLSHLGMDSTSRRKEGLDEGAEVKKALPSTSVDDVDSVRQLRQRRIGVGLWAIRRQKMERAAQLRPRIVVHMSRLRGRKTAADFSAANLSKKRRLRCSAPATAAARTITTNTATDTRNGSSVDADTETHAANGLKLEQLEEYGVGDEVDRSEMTDKENNGKSSGDAVNSRPKRQIMHKKLVSAYCIKVSK